MGSVKDLRPAEMDIGDIPQELLLQPAPCVAFVGLDPSNKQHAYIWGSFSSNRQPDRPPIYYRLIDSESALPLCKPKKSSYEWHIPKGILKSNWLRKHLFEIPCVAVAFFPLDWSDPRWEEMLNNYAEKIEQLKAKLSGRNTRLAVVLIQNNMSPPGDDILATERASVFCNTCDLSPKSLFVLPITDTQNFFGYILRMEAAIFDMAKTYYQHEIKTIKNHKEQLNKTTHSLLFVRHMFKIAFFSEFRQDFPTAVKSYKHSYAYLMEIRLSPVNLFEIKTLAGFINYKICRLLFMQNDPMDAISHFRKHIDIFKNKTEPKEIEFEHFAWLSKQFMVLGDLFDQAIAYGLVPSQMQHPGYYYHEAAMQAIKRKKLARKLSVGITVTDSSYLTTLASYPPLEFYGQRPWRPGCQSLEPLDMELEREGFATLLYKEVHDFNHTAAIINILSCAVSQFKKHKCPRMMRHMMVLIAEEYFSDGDYENASVFLNQVLPYYRLEQWKPILVNLLTMALYSAYYAASIADFVKVSLEYVSSWNDKPQDDREAVQQSLTNVLKCEPPLPLGPYNQEQCSQKWMEAIRTTEKESIIVNMNAAIAFVELKVTFETGSIFIDQEVRVSVYFRSNCPCPLYFNEACISFSQPYYDQFCVINNTGLGNDTFRRLENSGSSKVEELCLLPGKTYAATFAFKPLPDDAQKHIDIVSASLFLGKEPIEVTLHWPLQVSNDVPTQDSRIQFKNSADVFSYPSLHHGINILSRPANILFNVEHSPPALLSESYKITLALSNLEEKPISNLRLTVERTKKVEGVTQKMLADGAEVEENEEVQITKELSCNETTRKTLSLPSLILGPHAFRITVLYNTTSSTFSEQLVCSKFVDFDFETILPFKCTFTILNIRENQVSGLRALEPFILRASTKSLSCHRLLFESFQLKLNQGVSANISGDDCPEFRACGQTLEFDKSVETQYVLHCNEIIQTPTTLGALVVKWRRENDETVNETTLALPELTVEKSLLYVEALLPPYGITRQHLQLICVIHNRTDDTLTLELSMENSDNFMYSGNKQVKLELPPRDALKQYYILYPLVCGYVSLPKLRLVAFPDTPSAMPMDHLLEELMPAFLQIMPQEKKLLNQTEEILAMH